MLFDNAYECFDPDYRDSFSMGVKGLSNDVTWQNFLFYKYLYYFGTFICTWNKPVSGQRLRNVERLTVLVLS